MKKDVVIYFTILLGLICLTGCSNKKELTCVDIDTNQAGNTSEMLGQKIVAEIYSDNIKFIGSDDTATGYDSFTVKIVDDNTFEVPNASDIFDVHVTWFVPFIHQAWNIEEVYLRANFPNGKYVYLTYE